MEELYSVEQIAERYGVTRGTVWEWIRGKKLTAIRPGKEYRIKESDLLAFEQASKTTA